MPTLSGALARGGAGRRSGASVLIGCTALLLAVLALVLVATKPRRGKTSLLQRGGRQEVLIPTLGDGSQQLLGYDPYGSVRHPGTHPGLIADDYNMDDGEEERLPSWATHWPADAEAPCEAGAQCMDNFGNPLGQLGKWVMEKTAPHYTTKRDYFLRHNCLNLPGWAVEECHRMRTLEEKQEKEEEEARKQEGMAPKKVPEAGEEEDKADETAGGKADEKQAAKEKEAGKGTTTAERARATLLAQLARSRIARAQRDIQRGVASREWLKPLASEIARDIVQDERRMGRGRARRGGQEAGYVVVPADEVRFA